MQISSNGFTLLEIVVTIVLAGLLYSIVVPIVPKSILPKSKMSLQVVLKELESIRMKSEYNSTISFVCKKFNHCSFYENGKVIKDGIELEINDVNSFVEYKRGFDANLVENVSHSDDKMVLKLNKFGLPDSKVYFFDNAYYVIGGSRILAVASTKDEAEKLEYNEAILSKGYDEIAK